MRAELSAGRRRVLKYKFKIVQNNHGSHTKIRPP
jgi:hypothetical protein